MGFGVPSCLHLSCFICHASFCSPAPSYCSPPLPLPPSSHAASYHPLPDCQRVSGWYSIHSDRGAKKSEFSFSVLGLVRGAGPGRAKLMVSGLPADSSPGERLRSKWASVCLASLLSIVKSLYLHVNPGRASVSGFYQTPMCTVSQSSTKRSREAL